MRLLHMPPFLRGLTAFLGSILLYGCSAAVVLNAIIPQSGYKEFKNIAYGKLPRQQLDIYVPDDVKPGAPVIVFFYGGSWKKGSKDDYRFVGQAFASKGYITVIPDYRLYPEVYFPEFMQDSAQAFVWAHENIKNYGADPHKLFVAGHSAGAYNAMMLTLNQEYLRAAGGKRGWIRGAFGLAGPYDFLPFTDPDIISIFSKETDRLTQPINFVGSHLPPILLMTGEADTEVYPKNSINLARALKEKGNMVTLHTYPEVEHIGIVLALADGFRAKAPVLEDIHQFISHVLEKDTQ